MKALKNILIGFLVSFLGSIPLSYLNMIGFQINHKFGVKSLIFYLFGVISIEVFVVYFTLIFAKQLFNNKRLSKFIDVFSMFFMLLLAYFFYSQSNSETSVPEIALKYWGYYPYFIGVILSGFNFIQIPFWTSWNLYLINAKFISLEKMFKYWYVLGTLIGTFFGMLALILGLNLITQNYELISKYILSTIIPLLFLGMALFQVVVFFKRHFNSKN